ncbi:adenosine deaminase [Ruegeria lacuscaerulensis]|uniref:adenosine deaminase n=1 Tax=Ruegeria lacuscaerulensis TaxID=55218 RepID=UPI00147E2AB8|nr:adenosine deaminase [Ruegeria lacuscaerulensis]
MDMKQFIQEMPKAELHLHIEGTVSPKRVLELADRNGVNIEFKSEKELLDAQDYGTPPLENFLKYHYMCSDVLRTGRDIFEITQDYLEKCVIENTRHVELSFDPQGHLERGIEFGELIDALNKARKDSPVSTQLVMCMNRDRTLESALEMLKLAEDYKDDIVGLGLDSVEEGNPPVKFQEYYDRGRELGFKLTAHCDCDQNNAVEHARQCIHDLGVHRIDHGVHVMDDPQLIEDVKERGITLTMCPTWRLGDPGPRRIPAIRKMLEMNVPACLNTDDPEEFASRYMSNMLSVVQEQGEFSAEEMTQFMRNAFVGSWIPDARRGAYLKELNAHLNTFKYKSDTS